ncbi:geranylgeranyl reductase family protein [Sulfuriferula nivalis]|uniref:Geranylgeranyl reductase n=1 Tax=Sulfuriferula nivalis TaxID=2675298 RepID=A0A809SB23_9PROT|nr:geranylgeranyl reductase family protein [Sulfuriferula nivalis]BBP02012.1 geranylgeranyl reductase [Sulfuriferula nivalis]
MKQIDVLIIGLGPAGAAAALAAAQGGLSVMGVDRRHEIGVPVQCAEFIPLPMGKYAKADGVLYQHIKGMKSFLPSGAVAETEFPGLMINRAAFDQAIATAALDQGADLWLNSRLVSLDVTNNIATIHTEDGEVDIEYRLLVAADGPHSPVAQSLCLPEMEVVTTRQYTVPLKREYVDTDIWLSADYPGGYAWLFPKGNWANLGLGLDKRFTSDMKKPLDELHSQLVAQGLVGEEITYRTGGAIPVGGLREHLVIGNILFVGDAAGLTHPITGAGIAAAVISGERAGQAAVGLLREQDAGALEDFEEDVRDQFEIAVSRAVARRKWLDQQWLTEAAQTDGLHRKSWIAFPDYFVS